MRVILVQSTDGAWALRRFGPPSHLEPLADGIAKRDIAGGGEDAPSDNFRTTMEAMAQSMVTMALRKGCHGNLSHTPVTQGAPCGPSVLGWPSSDGSRGAYSRRGISCSSRDMVSQELSSAYLCRQQ